MRATHERRPDPPDASFRCVAGRSRRFPFFWHYQSDYELTLITRGRGRRLIGDHIDRFEAGDLVLVGPYLPHTWVSEPDARAKANSNTTVFVQFAPDFLGKGTFERPEMSRVAHLLERSRRGIRFLGAGATRASALISELPTSNGVPRILRLLEVLDILSRERKVQYLASPRYAARRPVTTSDRITSALEYLGERFADPIGFRDVARHVHMSPTAFAHFFKRSTSVTLTAYLNELRIGHACSRLLSSDDTVTEIAYASGFSSLPYFNRKFLQLKRMTPSQFRREFAGE